MAAAPNPNPNVLPPPPIPANVQGQMQHEGQPVVNQDQALAWLEERLDPSANNIEFLLTYIFPELGPTLTTCGLSNRQQLAIVRQGITRLNQIHMLGRTFKDVRELLKSWTTLPRTRGGVIFGAVQYTNLYALIYWVQDKKRRGLDPLAFNFTPQILEEYVELSQEEKTIEEVTDATKPPKLEIHDRKSWGTIILCCAT